MQWPLARCSAAADGSGTSRISAVVKAEQIGLHWLKFASTMRRNLRAWVRRQSAPPAGGVAALGIVEAMASRQSIHPY
jgi:hypothetical protein